MNKEKSIVDKLQHEVGERSREIWLAGLGAFSAAEEEGNKLYNSFVEKGKELVDKGQELEKKGLDFGSEKQKEVNQKVNNMVKFMEEKFNNTMEGFGFPPRSEVKELSEKVDKLAATVEKLAKKIDTK